MMTGSRYSLAADYKLYAIAVVVIAICFGVWLVRPYSVLSDIGYQAFSARQYVDHYAPVFNTVRLVDPHDLAKDVTTPLTAWAPAWTGLFVLAFKGGLSAGRAGRLIALFLSLAGAIGWVRVSSMVGLKGRWRIVGVAFAALYCLRTGTMSKTGAGDQIIYAVAPWLLLAAAPLAVRLGAGKRGIISRTILLSLALGAVYWLKYSGIFLSLAILTAVVIEQIRGLNWKRLAGVAGLLTIYGITFMIPILALKAYNYRLSGSDFVETSAHFSPPRTVARMADLMRETAYGASTILFSAGTGADQLVQVPSMTYPSVYAWLERVPGMALLAIFFYLMSRRPPGYIRNVTLLAGVIPLLAFPALSFAAGLRFSYAIARCCEPYWVLFELLIFGMIASLAKDETRLFRRPRLVLCIAVAFQMILFLWIPISWARLLLYVSHSPPYRTSAAELWDTDLSRFGTRDIDDRVRSLIRTPRDIVVPAIYSDRGFATDTMLEFGGRLLPLSVFFVPLAQTHGRDGANYNSSKPFVSSTPLRIILVAPDPYKRGDFQQLSEGVRRRFTQVKHWVLGPPDPDGRVWIWIGETI